MTSAYMNLEEAALEVSPSSAHFRGSRHLLVQSYKPGEDWRWCFVDAVAFTVVGASTQVHP